jgi:hypothetical protein
MPATCGALVEYDEPADQAADLTVPARRAKPGKPTPRSALASQQASILVGPGTRTRLGWVDIGISW